MNTMDLYLDVAERCSQSATEQYSTSFSSAIRLLHKDLHRPIYAIYGLVRFADEIVDTFHEHDKPKLLAQFRRDTFEAIEQGISLNPILHAFQQTVRRFRIDHSLIEAFFRSMEMDLNKTEYLTNTDLDEYIYGSAEVVGLMCLYVFCEGNKKAYEELVPAARALGAAFQKVNFLRDLGSDYKDLQRAYFPGFSLDRFDHRTKQEIEQSILEDFCNAYAGIRKLPMKARFGVYVAYRYYFSLFKKIQSLSPDHVVERRIRIPNLVKMMIVCRAGLCNQLNLI